jgi:hypothetical protein
MLPLLPTVRHAGPWKASVSNAELFPRFTNRRQFAADDLKRRGENLLGVGDDALKAAESLV